jgi:NDP-sugar pyrophosphorylase family protein
MYPVIILAGGFGTRLGNLAKYKPKSLILINNKPFIYWQLKLLEKQGIKEILLCVSHFAGMIISYINQEKFNLDFYFSVDGEERLGTAGAIKKAIPFISSNNFFVMYGDSYLPFIDFKEVQNKFEQSNNNLLLTIYDENGILNNIDYDGEKILSYGHSNKSKYIDYGLSIYNKDCFKILEEKRFCNLDMIIKNQISKKDIIGFEIFKPYYEIGSLEGIIKLERSKDVFKNVFRSIT